MASSSKSIKAKKATPKANKTVKAGPRPVPTVELKAPVLRTVPNHKHSPPGLNRVLLEHVYWLGAALKAGDKDRAQNEVNALARFSVIYQTFTKNPNEQEIKYSSPVERYGLDKPKSRMGSVEEPTEVAEDDLEVA